MTRSPVVPYPGGERRSGEAPPAAPPVRRRVAFYSHDTQGLGHVRRNLALAGALVAREPQTDTLVLTGAPEASALPLPPRTDVVTVPTLSKDRTGAYSARRLSAPLGQLLQLRSDILTAALTTFAPDLLVVDKVPRGVGGELEPALRALRSAGRTRTVLGLREVLDDPGTAVRELRADRVAEAVRDWYDEVWVYGDPAVYDLVREYDLPASLAEKVVHTGYLGRGRGVGLLPSGTTDPAAVAPPGPYVLGLVGGGQDGHALAAAFAAAPMPPGHTGLLLTGPYMRRSDRQSLAAAAQERPDLRVVEFTADVDAHLAGASAVVAMAGYNTVCEVLAAHKRVLLVPRTTPRAEQLVRAHSLQRLGLVDVCLPDQLEPAGVGRWLAEAVLAGVPRGACVDLDGLRTVPDLAADLLRAGPPPPARPAPPTRAVRTGRPTESEDVLVAR